MNNTERDNLSRARDQLEVAYNQRDMNGILRLYDETPLFVDHALGQTLTSIDEIRDYVLAQSAPSSADEVEITDLIATGDWTIARFVNTGVNDRAYGDFPGTNRPFTVDLCTMTKWQDGKIIEDHVYYDLYGVLVQLGHAEPLTAAPQTG
jgi:hypothetical protein